MSLDIELCCPPGGGGVNLFHIIAQLRHWSCTLPQDRGILLQHAAKWQGHLLVQHDTLYSSLLWRAREESFEYVQASLGFSAGMAC